MKKIRTQIQLEPMEHERLREEARRRGISMSQLVREAIREQLSPPSVQEDAVERFLKAAGAGREPDGARHVARDHDRFLHG